MRTMMRTCVTFGILSAWIGFRADAATPTATPAVSQEKVRIDGQEVSLDVDSDRRLTISSSCRKASGKYDCEAHRAFGKASLRGLEKHLAGGANPGAVVCDRQFRAEIAIARDSRGNENSFCRFKDGSLVENGSLAYAADQEAKRSTGRSKK